MGDWDIQTPTTRPRQLCRCKAGVQMMAADLAQLKARAKVDEAFLGVASDPSGFRDG